MCPLFVYTVNGWNDDDKLLWLIVRNTGKAGHFARECVQVALRITTPRQKEATTAGNTGQNPGTQAANNINVLQIFVTLSAKTRIVRKTSEFFKAVSTVFFKE